MMEADDKMTVSEFYTPYIKWKIDATSKSKEKLWIFILEIILLQTTRQKFLFNSNDIVYTCPIAVKIPRIT